jgi:cbb3-type cytochrome oxidase subunit 3
MLSEKQMNFILYWEAARERESKLARKLTGGLPMAAIFGLPIILSVVVVYIFFPDWYTKISDTTSGTFTVIVIAVLIAIVFFAYFRMHFKWEMNEQLYLELKSLQKKGDA